MTRYVPALCWASAMVMLAMLARTGWIQREVANSLLLVMPILAFVAIRRRSCAARAA